MTECKHRGTDWLVPLGRLFFALIFIGAAAGHFSAQTAEMAASKGVPLPHLLVPLTGVMCLLGGVSVLLGYKARCGAWLLIAFLVPTTLMMHNFWAAPAAAYGMQKINFMKNLALIGAALLIAHFGSGPMSLDECGACGGARQAESGAAP